MKLSVALILFALSSSFMCMGMANNVRITNQVYEDYRESSMSNKNIEKAFNNIKTELPDGEYELKNVARMTLTESSLLCIESIEIKADSFTEHADNIKYRTFSDLDIVNNFLYADCIIRKLTSDRPEIEVETKGTNLTKIMGKNEFEVFTKEYDNLLTLR